MATGCLVTVVSGAAYERFAQDLFDSAEEFFEPVEQLVMVMLPGVPGWPLATMMRYRVLLDHADDYLFADYVWLVDADMRFEERVGEEVLGEIVATRHPGYMHVPADELPYERRSESICCVLEEEGNRYFAGGFVGGERIAFLDIAALIAKMVELDLERGITPRWHDESALNRVLVDRPPEVALSPAYCHPDDDSWYQTVWPEPYPRKLVALDKTARERGRR